MSGPTRLPLRRGAMSTSLSEPLVHGVVLVLALALVRRGVVHLDGDALGALELLADGGDDELTHHRPELVCVHGHVDGPQVAPLQPCALVATLGRHALTDAPGIN